QDHITELPFGIGVEPPLKTEKSEGRGPLETRKSDGRGPLETMEPEGRGPAQDHERRTAVRVEGSSR
ncbi:unnamed protein product, partial [Musa textilis]